MGRDERRGGSAPYADTSGRPAFTAAMPAAVVRNAPKARPHGRGGRRKTASSCSFSKTANDAELSRSAWCLATDVCDIMAV